jgi:RimJ/RimL family protein N-acetyltransferase
MSEAEVDIRPATVQDAQGLLSLLATLQTESTTFEVTGPTLAVEQQEQQISQIEQSDGHLIAVAALSGTLIGLVTVMPTADPAVGEIGVAVLKQYWHQGLGTALMLTGLDWAALESRYHVITLTVQERNQHAVALYEKLGFQTIQELSVKDPVGETVAALEMQIAVK